ncbi:MAG: serine protease, partial [Frankiales bacterium]|nr:serine protease [Frankiales bacterium]
MTRLRPALALAAGLALVAGAVGSSASAAPRSPAFATAAKASVTPGVQTVTSGAQCTANFVYTDGRSVFVGQSAHCAGLGAATETDGCKASSLPLGTAVTVAGASRPGRLVYSSWLAMKKAGERDANTCAYNDFALVRLDPADVGRTNPSVPVFGGPTGLDVDGTRAGEQVASWGNSSLRMGVAAFSPKTGVS